MRNNAYRTSFPRSSLRLEERRGPSSHGSSLDDLATVHAFAFVDTGWRRDENSQVAVDNVQQHGRRWRSTSVEIASLSYL